MIRRMSLSSKSSGLLFESERNVSLLEMGHYSGTYVFARQETPAEWRVRIYSHAKLTCSCQGSNPRILGVQSKRRVFNLNCRYWVDLVCTTQGVTIAFAKANVLDLAFPAKDSVVTEYGH
jgi:hypothetical protein